MGTSGVCFLSVGVHCVLYSFTNRAFSFVSIKCLIEISLYRADEALATRAENVSSILGTHMVERERTPLLSIHMPCRMHAHQTYTQNQCHRKRA